MFTRIFLSLKVYFTKTNAKLLNLNNFRWNANDLSRKFQGSNTTEGFIAIFEEIFGQQASETLISDEEDRDSPPLVNIDASLQPSQLPPAKKMKVMMPASRVARMERLSDEQNEMSESEMDKAIECHFKGMSVGGS